MRSESFANPNPKIQRLEQQSQNFTPSISNFINTVGSLVQGLSVAFGSSRTATVSSTNLLRRRTFTVVFDFSSVLVLSLTIPAPHSCGSLDLMQTLLLPREPNKSDESSYNAEAHVLLQYQDNMGKNYGNKPKAFFKFHTCPNSTLKISPPISPFVFYPHSKLSYGFYLRLAGQSEDMSVRPSVRYGFEKRGVPI